VENVPSLAAVYCSLIKQASQCILNLHNRHIWSNITQSAIKCRHQQQFTINVWTSTPGDCFIGPYVLPYRVNGTACLHFLEHTFCQSYWILSCWIFDKTCHSCMMVSQPISVMPPEITLRLLALRDGRGPVSWTSHSPDLNPFYFSFGDIYKKLVYSSAVNTAEELLQHIQNYYTLVCNTPSIFQSTHQSMHSGPNFMWQCKVNILNTYCKTNNSS
jgi:hypothetical protein